VSNARAGSGDQVALPPTFLIGEADVAVWPDDQYCMPHSQLRSSVSIVYLLDPGEPGEGWI
jgi:hypothetical protein